MPVRAEQVYAKEWDVKRMEYAKMAESGVRFVVDECVEVLSIRAVTCVGDVLSDNDRWIM